VLFDIWVVNSDRHPGNLAHDRTTNRVQAFDHGHAFFHTVNGKAYLEERRERLGVNNHCLLGALTSLDGMTDWSCRIKAIPEYYIREVVRAAAEVGLPADCVTFCTDYLLERRDRLLALVRNHRKRFPKISPALLDDLSGNGGAQ
jgi:hypothetical protein